MATAAHQAATAPVDAPSSTAKAKAATSTPRTCRRRSWVRREAGRRPDRGDPARGDPAREDPAREDPAREDPARDDGGVRGPAGTLLGANRAPSEVRPLALAERRPTGTSCARRPENSCPLCETGSRRASTLCPSKRPTPSGKCDKMRRLNCQNWLRTQISPVFSGRQARRVSVVRKENQ
jgi:hypothetical protein